MPNQPNFLLGYGENLTSPIQGPPRGQEPQHPYTLQEAVEHLAPMVRRASDEFRQLPQAACPHDQAVAVLTMHPQFYAKSYHPATLLRAAGMEPVGSRPTTIQPQKWTRKSAPEQAITTDLFVAATRSQFGSWAASLPDWSEGTPGAKDLFKVEQFRAMSVGDRLRPILSKEKEPLLEVVLHASGLPESNYIIEGFVAYLAQLNLKPDLDRRFHVGGLCFMPLRAPRELAEKVSQFSFLRVAREMPRLRPLDPILRSAGTKRVFAVQLPKEPAVDPNLKIAAFDGGIPKKSELSPWAEPREPSDVGSAVPDYMDHGFGVTSALLFGGLVEKQPAQRPYARVDHYRVLDKDSEKDPDELYDVLRRICVILQTRQYQFVNLSVGPALPVEDDDVHGWTAALDEIFSSGDILASVAVGNTGHLDWDSGNARVQVPSDCVNALAVGAADSRGVKWKRADYSSIGPGRSPGLVKPDVLGFGGSSKEPFWIVDRHSPGMAAPTTGTSYASPETLRMAAGVRAHFGGILSPLAIKALLVHAAEDGGHDRREAGWGRVPHALDDLVVCPPATARVVYQGELSPAQYLRARLPLPAEQLHGYVTIRATFCFAAETDPEDPSNYTRAGLEVTFRPHDQKFDENGVYPKPSAFFRQQEYQTETELRRDAHKWETTLHRSRRMNGKGLLNPVFDIHYNAREGGGPTRAAGKIRYALIVTVSAPKITDLYDRVVRTYQNILIPLRPLIQIPVRV